jgi:hypothetical protein
MPFISKLMITCCSWTRSPGIFGNAGTILSFKPQLRLEWRGQDGQNETEQPIIPPA